MKTDINRLRVVLAEKEDRQMVMRAAWRQSVHRLQMVHK